VIEIRKLAALDMAFNGVRFILIEFALGVVLPLALGFITIRPLLYHGTAQPGWETALGFWLIGIGLNYVPLLLYAVALARAGTVAEEGRKEVAHAKKYGLQQVIILVPLLVVIVALIQESRRKG